MFQRDPGYVAAQAYAMGLIVGECMRRADSLEDRSLLAAARELDTTTLYGGFRLDPGIQTFEPLRQNAIASQSQRRSV